MTTGSDPADRSAGLGPIKFKVIYEILGAVAVLAPLALALRALAVSHFDYSLAETLVGSTGSGTFLAVALAGIVPGFSYGAAMAIAYMLGREPKNVAVTVVVIIVLAAPQLLASTVPLAAAEVVSLPVVYLLGSRRSPRSHTLRDLLAILLALYLVFVALPLRMWVPAERVVMSGQPQTVYVLKESADHVSLFMPNTASIRLARLDSLSDRQFCAVGGRRSVGERIFGIVEVGMPRCP